MEGNIIFDKVLELANPVNNCLKHKQCYFVQKCVSLSHSIYLTISSCLCLQNHRTWLTDSCLEREHPTAAAFHPGLVFTPADLNRTPKVGVFLTPSLASWWKHCSPRGEDPLAILVQTVWLGRGPSGNNHFS